MNADDADKPVIESDLRILRGSKMENGKWRMENENGWL
jgi:hypothetical protein